MSSLDPTVGYPVHAVAEYAMRENPHGIRLTDWRAACGATGQSVGRDPFGRAGSARVRELCRQCWPAGHTTYHPAPKRVDATPTGSAADLARDP